MVYIFSNQNTNLGKFWRRLQWKILVYGHLVYFPPFWWVVSVKIWQPDQGPRKKRFHLTTSEWYLEMELSKTIFTSWFLNTHFNCQWLWRNRSARVVGILIEFTSRGFESRSNAWPAKHLVSRWQRKHPWFESRQGVRLIEIYTLQCCCNNMYCHCEYLRKK
jgi:hypothetical protein